MYRNVAPGNKTSHLASLLFTHARRDFTKNTVFAFDKSAARSILLSERMHSAGERFSCRHYILMAFILCRSSCCQHDDVKPLLCSRVIVLICIAGALNVKVQTMDFLQVDESADKFANVRYLLVDPSCSGPPVTKRLSSSCNDMCFILHA